MVQPKSSVVVSYWNKTTTNQTNNEYNKQEGLHVLILDVCKHMP